MFAALAFLALTIEAAAGYPQLLFAAIGHPVTWIGALIDWCEEAWNHPRLSFAWRCANGVVTLTLVLVLTIAVAAGLEFVAGYYLPWAVGTLLLGLLASTLIAQRSLDEHVRAVADGLETGGIEAGRAAVAEIVGRDTREIDESAVSRAAIESLAENFSDGVVAPVFWLAVAGLPGGAAYKAINTADSMIGHKSERYMAFGWASARLDDLVNLPASRLAAFWLVAAAGLLAECSSRAAWMTVRRDARHHRSPNAGWPEAAMAGALGIKLAGPRAYGGVTVDDGFVGDGKAELSAADIRAAVKLYRLACALQGAAVGALALVTLFT
jgi:adenosylcobinamide-phosphate synthase